MAEGVFGGIMKNANYPGLQVVSISATHAMVASVSPACFVIQRMCSGLFSAAYAIAPCFVDNAGKVQKNIMHHQRFGEIK
ncbi:hypothetical protein D3C72_2392740 [compost metagenome]